MTFHAPEKYRISPAGFESDSTDGNNGVFMVKSMKLKRPLRCIISDGGGWEHVSVSLPDRCPTWEEMCFIKSVFWDAEDVCIQYHPREADYVNVHSFCLHIWRPTFCSLPVPDPIMIGPKC